MKQTDLCHGTE